MLSLSSVVGRWGARVLGLSRRKPRLLPRSTPEEPGEPPRTGRRSLDVRANELEITLLAGP
jgi:hypothetical protein